MDMRMTGLMRLKGDVLGGLVVALLSLPMTIPLGALALSPLGPDYVSAGVSAGFQASIVAGAISALAGGSRFQISGPRASISLILAGAITIALSNGAAPQQAMVLGFVVVFLGGLTQILLGMARIGKAIKYIPYPVLAGFMNGVAVLIVLGQLAAALGLPSTMKWSAIGGHLSEISFPALAVTLATMAMMKLAPRLTTKLPAITIAFVGGVGLDHILRLALGGTALGPLVGTLGGGFPTPATVQRMLDLPWGGAAPGWLLAEIPTVLVLALVGSIESLLSAAAVDAVTGDNHNGNRELVGQGLGNCVGACFGGVSSTGAPIRGITSHRVGGRSRLAGVFHSLVLLALLLWGKPVLAALPYSVMAGIMIMIAVTMTDNWAFVLAHKSGRSFLADGAVVALVAVITVLANLAVAVFSGVILTLLLFMMHMSRPVVRRVFDRTETKSLRRRPLQIEAVLSSEGPRAVFMEMEGPLFFGTTERFREEFDRVVERAPSVVVLDLRKVRYFDLAGVRALRQAALRQKPAGFTLLLAGIEDRGARRNWLMAAGLGAVFPSRNIFPLLDRAVEAAENIILTGRDGGGEAEFPLAEIDMLAGLSDTEIDHLSGLLRHCRYSTGESIFFSGDHGDGLFLLVSGAVEINLPGDAPIRLAAFGPGTIFGEMALLGGKPRSADAVTLEPATAYWLSNENFLAFQSLRPAAAIRMLLNIGHEMSERLRLANVRLQAET